MKDDEKALLEKLISRGNSMEPSAWEIAESLGIEYKRARYILRDKWASRDWYDYGVSWRVGWLNFEMVINAKRN